MWCLKVLPCSKRYCHDWTTCPWAHAQEKAKRRDPRVYNYTGVACPEMKKSMQCPRGDQCPYAHNVFEYWLHHSRYRTQLCNDGVGCKRKICFFAHTLDELRVSSVKVQVPEGFRGDINSTAINPFAPSHGGPSPSKHQGGSSHGSNGSGYLQNASGQRGGAPVAAGTPPPAGLSLAELHQLGALQAKLQASQQMQQPGMYGAGAPGTPLGNDSAGLDQLVQLMLLQQQQQVPMPQQAPGGQQLMPEAMQQLMAQMMLAGQQQQQQQAAAALQVQQQVAALQLLNQMNQQGLGGYPPEAYSAAMGMPVDPMAARFPGALPGRNSLQHQNSSSMASALSVAVAAQQAEQAQMHSPVNNSLQAVDELARQLSGLTTNKLTTPAGVVPGGASDGPGSARSFASGGTPGANPAARPASSRAARQEGSSGSGGSAMGTKGHGNDIMGGMGAPQQHPPLASPHVPAGRASMMQHTSPVSVSALGDGYATTATANSYFSASHSVTSSHEDGSELDGLHHN